jgi:hypothetical protein
MCHIQLAPLFLRGGGDFSRLLVNIKKQARRFGFRPYIRARCGGICFGFGFLIIVYTFQLGLSRGFFRKIFLGVQGGRGRGVLRGPDRPKIETK